MKIVNSSNQQQILTSSRSRCYALQLRCTFLVISFLVVLRMCDSTDPARAAELYIMASEMNVVCSDIVLLDMKFAENISCAEKRKQKTKTSKSPPVYKSMTSQTLQANALPTKLQSNPHSKNGKAIF